MSLPISLYNIPREEIPLNEKCLVCLEDIGSDGGRQWLAHRDATNSKFIHPWHKDCAIRALGVSTLCLHRDVNLEVNSVLSLKEKFGISLLRNADWRFNYSFGSCRNYNNRSNFGRKSYREFKCIYFSSFFSTIGV
ncbi:MAG: hypothetical protein H0W50_04820 [Parachlamydiaceae bacterium]|nr:hypothetical protein [Parachlamydiaceae bacterium]